MFALLAALVLPIQGPAANPARPSVSGDAPPIRITLSGGSQFSSGDRVRVQVETADDGYLVVLRVDTDGHIRVLFPIDPDLDPFVRGGRTYELRGRADRQTFLADDHNGTGVIYAAVSREPLRFRDFTVGNHWDYDALRLSDSGSDAEAELSRFVTQMTDNGHFDYDIVNYTVTGPYIASVGGAYPTVYGNYGYGGAYGLGYDPYWNCLSCRWGYDPYGFGMNFGFGGGRYGSFYDPWNYDPFYYGYGSYSYPGSYWRYPGQSLPYTVITLPRPQVPSTAYGIRSRVRPSIPVPAGDLTRLGRSGAPGSGAAVGNRGGNPNAGTYVGDRARERGVRQPSSSSEPARAPASAPRVDRTPPPSSGSGANRGASSGGASSGTRSRPRGGGVDAQQVMPAAPVSINRRTDEPRPVFREPPRPRPTTIPITRDYGRQDAPRPVYREPPRVERSWPSPSSAPSVSRSAPPPSAPPPAAAPARTSGGGAPSAPARSRQGGGGGH